ncbi:MAG: FliA/WhiG family RNA polymerase sigma factor [Candidatus Latescibacteria bacterium]|mgnify:CR=1 FL=1|jgi:RNA polymerase sigma factor FliA|nr:FliA/WhiG family RNA polymerase sigma factor [Candidatus Latescibacterota bacterium]
MVDRNTSDGRRVKQNQRGLNTYHKMLPTPKRDELVKKHLKLVSFIASRLAIGLPDWIDKRDLVSAGVIGLIDAVNNFDTGRGVKLETYAKTRIRGAIIDELRSLDWIPRSTRAKSREIERAISKLNSEMNRFPTDEEIANELEWDMKKYYKALGQVSITTLLSLDEMVSTTASGESVRRIDMLQGDTSSPLDSIERKELLDTVANILKELTEKERLVIALYYYEELTLKEIGIVLKVTESRVSQIHTTAILKLRTRLSSVYG